MLTDVHRNIIALMKAGQPLKTEKVFKVHTAKIGQQEIPLQYVQDLKNAGLIRCREVWDRGQQHGMICTWELME